MSRLLSFMMIVMTTVTQLFILRRSCVRPDTLFPLVSLIVAQICHRLLLLERRDAWPDERTGLQASDESTTKTGGWASDLQ